MKYMKYNYCIIKLIPFLILCIGCQSLQQTIQLDTNLDYFENAVTSIIFETEPGCKKTNFNFTDEYSKLNVKANNIFIASDFNEYENKIKKYFEMDYFKTITQEYFNKNIMAIIILTANDGQYLKNGKFEQGNNKNFIYKIELWDNGKPILFRKKCSYTKIFVINIGKNGNVLKK